ncbi:MAG: hypothetical protein KC964_21125, partial [Candidatus Omnitrophica bacterium]|nr:hypothetical protein [Candidatus Omnitrophota bacterium]
QSSFITRNRYGDFSATPLSRIEEGETWENIIRPNYVANSRATGRSVWNTEWMVVIPGINLNSDPIDGLNGFIYGDGSSDSGVKDIMLFFDTYSYSGAIDAKTKRDEGASIQAMKVETDQAYQSADSQLLQLKRNKINIATSPEADMPPMMLYGTMSSAHDGGMISSGSVEVQLEYRPLEPSVMASVKLSADSASYSYRVAVPVVESAFGAIDRLQRYERYQANINYSGDNTQSSIADLPPADYGVPVAMPPMAVQGVFSGSPTFTPTQTPIGGSNDTPTPTATGLQSPTRIPGTSTPTPTPTGPTPTPTNTPWPEYLIYAVLPLSGDNAQVGEDALRGAQLAVEDI